MTSAAANSVQTLARLVPAVERGIPVDESLASILPEGLQRGRVHACTGPAAWSLTWALLARPTLAGSWAALVATPEPGWESAHEFGVQLGRLVAVAAEPSTWAERVAVAADGFDLIVTCPPPGAERYARRVRQRLQGRGSVLLAVDPRQPSIACDVELSAETLGWAGIGRGAGHLMARKAVVTASGRRIPRPLRCELLLPGPLGRVQS